MSKDDLILLEATPQQYAITIERQLLEWGKLSDSLELSLSQYASREKLLTSSSFGQRFRAWVLVPNSNPTTLNFLASCETYRRSSWVKIPSEKDAKRCVSYSIAGVIVPPELRGKGYSRKMLELLHLEFTPSSSSSTTSTSISTSSTNNKGSSEKWKGKDIELNISPEWQGRKDATFSFLFSDVGDFYSTFGNGWHVRSSYCTTWDVTQLPTQAISISSNSFIPITLENLEEITTQDSLHIQSSLSSSHLSSSTSNPTPTPSASLSGIFIAIEPTYSNYEWAILRSNFYAQLLNRSIPDTLGIYINKENFIMWIPDYPNEVLKIVRLVCSSSYSHFSSPSISTVNSQDDNYASVLFQELFKAARSYNLLKIEGWNVSSLILNQLGVGGERGITNERKDSLSCLSYYGASSDSPEVGVEEYGSDRGKNVHWTFNEAYAWC